jgi:hypothetical protein
MARFGLVARGLVYALVAWVVVELALGRASSSANTQGALGLLARHALGRAVVAAVGVGFAGLAVWQATVALRRSPGPARRLAAAGKCVVYAMLCALSVSIALHHSKGGDEPFTGPLLRHPLGRACVGLVGFAIEVGAVVVLVKGLRKRYDVDVTPPREGRGAFDAVGVVAMSGRALVFGLIGGWLIDAAVTANPGKAQGLDSVLRSLVRSPDGPWLLAVVAAGLAAFACFSALEARYARV